ncbi:MAG TPA: DNA polymerase III subunit epsilon [Stellaceae bacterium]|nr:DNA polymerase III subunit epsilon [Stellaceae bacterium]
MRELVIDTETTGLDPADGHRLVEIAVIELMNHLPTGRTYHAYINPERDMPEAAQAVHGLSAEFLSSHPVFANVAREFLDFVGDGALVIHNAEFDLAFLNAELTRAGLTRLALPVVDTLLLARQRFPGQPANLDALCRRFAIDLSGREKHGAMIDGRLLAAVYLELIGGRQPGLDLNAVETAVSPISVIARAPRPARPHVPSAEELLAHAAFLLKLKQPLWQS